MMSFIPAFTRYVFEVEVGFTIYGSRSRMYGSDRGFRGQKNGCP